LSISDFVVAGGAWGRVKALTNDQGGSVKAVIPGTPVEVLGFGSLPEAGDTFSVVDNERLARSLATKRRESKARQLNQGRALTLDQVVNQIDAGDVKELNLVLKADVQGSVEALRQSLEHITEGEAKVRILHAGSGGITESDILLASASDAIIVGFNVGEELGIDRVSERMGVEIRHYQIIYQLIEDIERALHGILEPTYSDIIIGRAEVREIFPSKRNVQIAGCRVMEGRITRGGAIRILRNGEIVTESTIASLRHFRDEVNEINTGVECGIMLQGFNAYETGDILEAHRQERNPI